MNKVCLLTGGTGNLGKRLKFHLSKEFTLLSPLRNELDIINKSSVISFFESNKIDLIIHTAAMARMKECEENKREALKVNSEGTLNLVRAAKKSQDEIRFIYISTDGVYPSKVGNYGEQSILEPYNYYGLTKLMGEFSVRTLSNFCIIRTRFFDPDNIPFAESANDIFSSSIDINKLVKIIVKISSMEVFGILNVGSFESLSDYERYKPFKKTLKESKRKYITQNLNFEIATNATMDLSKLKKLDLDD